MEVTIGFVLGVATAWLVAWWRVRLALRQDQAIANKVRNIEWVLKRHELMCGAGYPCSGGPNCKFDHK